MNPCQKSPWLICHVLWFYVSNVPFIHLFWWLLKCIQSLSSCSKGDETEEQKNLGYSITGLVYKEADSSVQSCLAAVLHIFSYWKRADSLLSTHAVDQGIHVNQLWFIMLQFNLYIFALWEILWKPQMVTMHLKIKIKD